MTTITTQNGTELELCAVSSYYIAGVRNKAISDFEQDRGKLLAPPTYDIKCGGGPFGEWIETKAHTTETIEQGTNDEKAAWNAYTAQQKEQTNFIYRRTARVYLLRGITTEVPDNGWRERQERDEIEIPTDLDDLKMHWIETETVMTAFELGMIVNTIQSQNQLTEVGRRLATDMFQRAMELGRWPNT